MTLHQSFKAKRQPFMMLRKGMIKQYKRMELNIGSLINKRNLMINGD